MRMGAFSHLIFSSVAPSSTGIPTSKTFHSSSQEPCLKHQQLLFSRRNALLLPIVPVLLQPCTATAFSLGIPGPKEWLKEQKKKTANYLLAPVDASRKSLGNAYGLLLRDSESEVSFDNAEEVRKLVKGASRDCVVRERNSFVAFQSQTGVEVCTFRLIVNNASSLLDSKDPKKVEAETILEDLIRSFTSLNGMADGDLQNISVRKKVIDELMDTISSLEKFREGIEHCLEL